MIPTDLGNGWWTALGYATVSSGLYLAWVPTFERWLDPFLRRCASALVGCRVVWVTAGKPFRVWGIQDDALRAKEGLVTLMGCLTILFGALASSLALLNLGGGEQRIMRPRSRRQRSWS